ncbi:MAG: glutathione S-transferase family protein [Pseudomonadota bacterium]
MTLRLHWSPDSANLPVRVALEELELPYETTLVDRTKGEHRSADYRALNPQGLLPVLQDGDLVLFETGAILLHIAERAGHLGPDGPAADDPAARARCLPWLFWVSNTLHADLRCGFYSHRWIGDEGVAMLRAGVSKRLIAHIALVEETLSHTGALVADTPTIADIYLAMCLRWMQIYPPGRHLLPSMPDGRTKAFLARLETRPAFERAFEAESIPSPGLTRPRRPTLPPEAVIG